MSPTLADRVQTWLRPLARPRGVFPLLAVNVVLIWVFGRLTASFIAAGMPDMASLELAFDPGTLRHVLTLWAEKSGATDAMPLVRLTLWTADLLFPIFYAALISATYWWFLNTANVPEPAQGQPIVITEVKPHRLRLLLPWFAAILDYVKNALLLMLVPKTDALVDGAALPPALVFAMSFVSALKWTCIVIALILCVHALFTGPRRTVLRLSRYSLLSIALGSLPLAVSDQGLDLVISVCESPGAGWVLLYTTLWAWALSVWYWSRVLLDAGRPSQAGSQTFIEWAKWTPRVLGTVTMAAPAAAFINAHKIAPNLPLRPIYAAVLCLGSAVAFFLIVTFRRTAIHRWMKTPTTGFSPKLLAKGARRVAVLSLLVSFTLFALLVSRPIEFGSWLGAPVIVLIVAANTVFLGSVAVFVAGWWQLPFDAIALLCAAAFSLWNDNHDVRAAAGAAVEQRATADVAFRAWKALHPGPVVLVAAEGGGIRAAYWTALVLGKVRTDVPEAAPHMLALSGISGGSLGGAVYAALLHDRVPAGSLGDRAKAVLSGGFLSPVLAKMLTGDLMQWFIPIPVRAFDRSTAMEKAFAEAYRINGQQLQSKDEDANPFTKPFLDLEAGGSSNVPALFLTSVSVERGARVVIGPWKWPKPEIGEDVRRDRIDLHEQLRGDLTLAQAVHNSARFTFVSPAGRLFDRLGEDRGHVVDGGYFENTGIETALDLIDAVDRDGREKFVVLVLCNTPGGCARPAADAPEVGAADVTPAVTSWEQRRHLGELLSPVRALLATRDMRGALAHARLARPNVEHVEFGICDLDGGKASEAPLGWQLSEEAQKLLDRQVRECTDKSMQDLRLKLAAATATSTAPGGPGARR